MADTILQDNQNVTVAIGFSDKAGNPVTGTTLDAGSVTATFPETSNLTAVVSADQTSVLVTSEGPLVVGDVLTVTGSLNGAPLTAGTLPFDVTASAPASITLTPGTPVAN
jgi:hypothetical protein